MANNFSQKNIWIIGASFGIGEELYHQFSKLGANLAISARTDDKLKEMVGVSSGHLVVTADVTDLESMKLSFQKIKDHWSKIDLIIFSAGAYQPMSVSNFDLRKAKDIVDVNFNSLLNLIDVILPEIKLQKISHLAIIGSVAGYFGMHNSLAYGASKAALINLTESLNLEFKKYQAKVSLVNPGFVKTRLTDQNNFKMPWLLDPKEAAELIINNLSKNKFEIAFPWQLVWVMKLVKIMPYKIKMLILNKIK